MDYRQAWIEQWPERSAKTVSVDRSAPGRPTHKQPRRLMARNKYRLLLIELTADQSDHAKTQNGPRKRITHAVMVPGVGQRFGTLNQCTQYYQAWEQLYSSLLLRRGEQLRGS